MTLSLALAFGIRTRQWQLLRHASRALITATLIIGFTGALVGLLTPGPIGFDMFPSTAEGIILSLLVGIAGALGTADDAGHRQLVGLAAASQLALIPVWLGLSWVYGLPPEALHKASGFAGNVVALISGALLGYRILSLHAIALRRIDRRKTDAV